MPGTANDLNISEAGYVTHNGLGVFHGRTFQAGTGITLTNADGISGNTTIASTASLTDLHVARFIVASSTSGTGANFTTIASAITAAQATGINSTIFIQPGTYTENLTLVAGVNLCAFDCDAVTPNVLIVGKLTATFSGQMIISGIQLETNNDFILVNSGSNATSVEFINCLINSNNHIGISYTNSNNQSFIQFSYSQLDVNTTGISNFASSSSGAINFSYCQGSDGISSTPSTISAGTCAMGYCSFQSPFVSSGTAGLSLSHCDINTSSQNATALTFGGSGFNEVSHSGIASGSATALSISSTAIVDQVEVSSSNTHAISGAGTINYGFITFTSSSSNVNTVVQNVLPTLPASGGGGGGFTSVNIQTFSTSGTYTPTSGMKYCIVEIVGGGGSGGGATATGGGQASVGAGGGAGEIARSTFSTATIGVSQSVTIGAAGVVNSGATGGNGGTTSVGALISANGGIGGATVAATNFGITPGSAGGSGGSGGTFDSPGVTGTDAFCNPGGGVGWSGAGGSSPYGGGGQRITYNAVGGNNALGNSAVGFGSGGGGGINSATQGTPTNGGSATAGYVLITEYIS